MKKQIFAVCDTEEEYARNFMDYISRRKNIPFEIRAFTSADSLIAFARKNHIELLLISQEAMCREIRDLDIGKVIILTEECSRRNSVLMREFINTSRLPR